MPWKHYEHLEYYTDGPKVGLVQVSPILPKFEFTDFALILFLAINFSENYKLIKSFS
jgi:hypothetical protein